MNKNCTVQLVRRSWLQKIIPFTFLTYKISFSRDLKVEIRITGNLIVKDFESLHVDLYY